MAGRMKTTRNSTVFIHGSHKGEPIMTEWLYEGLHNSSSIRSKEGIDIAWVDEAQYVTKGSLDDLIPTIRKDGSQLWFSWNPRSPLDPIDQLLRGQEPPPFDPKLAHRRVALASLDDLVGAGE
jgi:PBSX family phage terminase large subunit